MTTELLMNSFFKRLAFTIEMRAFSAKMLRVLLILCQFFQINAHHTFLHDLFISV